MTASRLAHTLAEQLHTSKVPFETLHETYHPVLVRELIGVIPNCDQLLEVWPAGFRTYNLVVPDFLNLPLSLLGVAMMGFPDKFMDAVGVELEPEALADVGAPLLAAGWRPGKHVDPGASMPASSATVAVDNLGTYLRIVRQAPAAIRLERQWTAGVW